MATYGYGNSGGKSRINANNVRGRDVNLRMGSVNASGRGRPTGRVGGSVAGTGFNIVSGAGSGTTRARGMAGAGRTPNWNFANVGPSGADRARAQFTNELAGMGRTLNRIENIAQGLQSGRITASPQRSRISPAFKALPRTKQAKVIGGALGKAAVQSVGSTGALLIGTAGVYGGGVLAAKGTRHLASKVQTRQLAKKKARAATVAGGAGGGASRVKSPATGKPAPSKATSTAKNGTRVNANGKGKSAGRRNFRPRRDAKGRFAGSY